MQVANSSDRSTPVHSQSPKFMVAQLGARGHYAVSRTLYAAGRLERFYTDICALKGFPKYLGLIPHGLQSQSIRRMMGRIPQGVTPDLITAFSGFGLTYALRLQRAKSTDEVIQTFLWAGKTFGELVLKQGLKGEGIYLFNTAGLELLKAAKQAGMRTVLEQTIAPYQVEQQLLEQEHDLHPGWELPPEKNKRLTEYTEREQQEWELADVILCGSDFVSDGIQKCQGPTERCIVTPYGISSQFKALPKSPHGGPLRVLTVGAVGLRKGTPYVLEAAKRLQGKATFRLVGPMPILPEKLAELQKHTEVIGVVSRAQVVEHYHWADVFLLPSICEGSATVTYEALACGVPVIATANTGSIVEDGINGRIVPIRDVGAIVQQLALWHDQPQLLEMLGQAAMRRSAFGSFNQYSDRLLQIL